MRISLKDHARSLGITIQEIALQLRKGFYGDEIMRVQRDRDEVKIMLRYPENERNSEAQLENIRIRLPDGSELPFHVLANVENRAGIETIRREERMRHISVTAKAVGNNNAAIQEKLESDVLPVLSQKYGIIAKRGDDEQERVNSRVSMMKGMCVAIVIIYLIMATVFKSYLQPIVILLTIPFGFVGAAIGHWLFDTEISIMSFFGMVALTGIVVNDSIVLIVAINKRFREGDDFFDAIVEGGKRRFRAIILTSLTTFAGLFPMLLEKSFQAKFLIPMALSIAFGVIFATFATLVIIPCMLVVLNDIRRIFSFAWKLEWPSREEFDNNYCPRLFMCLQ